METNFVRVVGVKSQGFGIIPKMVMRDKNLTPEAKAIYAYICSFAGAGESAFPSLKIMLDELGMGLERFYKHRKLLEKYGYITIEQTKEKGKFSKNVYTINNVVSENPVSEDTTTENQVSEKPISENPVSENPILEKPISENPISNNNSINNNSINNNSINNNSSSSRYINNNNNNNNNNKSTTTTSNEKLEEVCNMYKREITNRVDCSPLEIQTLEKLLADYGLDRLKEGIEIAVKRNRRSLGYIEGILKKDNNEVKNNGQRFAGNHEQNTQAGKNKNIINGIDWSRFDG